MYWELQLLNMWIGGFEKTKIQKRTKEANVRPGRHVGRQNFLGLHMCDTNEQNLVLASSSSQLAMRITKQTRLMSFSVSPASFLKLETSLATFRLNSLWNLLANAKS